MSGRDANQLAQKQALVRNQGACGEASPDGEYICVLPPGEHAHPWDRASGDANQLAADVREALDDYHGYVASDPTEPDQPAYAALDELVALVGTLQQERDEALGKWQEIEHPFDKSEYDAMFARAEAAEAALNEMTAWRDEAEGLYRATAEHLRHTQGGDTAPRYDKERREWVGQCPHGDVCTGCDALGYCTREEAVT